jgi:protein gp37
VGKTSIEWTDATWNPIRGCSRISEGCRNCYAEGVAYRFSGPGKPYEGLVTIGPNGARRRQWNGQVKFVEKHLLDPLKWKAPRRVFVNSMSDLFHENVTDEIRDRIFAVMALCPQHTFQVLTKRPERMLNYLTGLSEVAAAWSRKIEKPFTASDVLNLRWMHWRLNQGPAFPYGPWPLPNVWLGASVENQAAADERIPLLLQTPAAVRFISAEPLLGPITFRWATWDSWTIAHPHFERAEVAEGRGGKRRLVREHDGLRMLDWVIVGGESGHDARPMHPGWAESLRDQCVAAGVPFFFKQWGLWHPGSNFQDHDVIAVDEEGRIAEGGFVESFPAGASSADGWEMMHRGKKSSGALLDGREWRQFPEVRA